MRMKKHKKTSKEGKVDILFLLLYIGKLLSLLLVYKFRIRIHAFVAIVIWICLEACTRYIGGFCGIVTCTERIRFRQLVLKVFRGIRYTVAFFLIFYTNGVVIWDKCDFLAKFLSREPFYSLDFSVIVENYFPQLGCRLMKSLFLMYFSFVLFWDFYDTYTSLTFRKWPCIILSTSCTLLFLICVGLPYENSAYVWGVINLSGLMKRIEEISGVVTGSVVVVALGSFGIYIGKEVLETHRDKIHGGTIKDSRRRLLSHWFFNPDIPISSNTIIWIIPCGFIICGITLYFTFAPGGSQESGVTAMEFMAVFATILFVFGSMSFAVIGNRGLVESEYFYILYHSIWLKNRSLDDKRHRWEDYFQVISYLYAVVSPLNSETRAWHNIDSVVAYVFRGPRGGRTPQEEGEFLSRLIYAYSEVRKQYAAEEERGNAISWNGTFKNSLSEELFADLLQSIISSTQKQ